MLFRFTGRYACWRHWRESPASFTLRLRWHCWSVPINSRETPNNLRPLHPKASMHPLFKLVLSSAIAVGALQSLSAQDLAPRAYTLTPLHANALTLTYGFYDGSLLLNGAIPVN